MRSKKAVNHVTGTDPRKMARPRGWAFGLSSLRSSVRTSDPCLRRLGVGGIQPVLRRFESLFSVILADYTCECGE